MDLDSPEMDFLKQCGLAQSTVVTVNADSLALRMAGAYLGAYHIRNKKEPAMWTLGNYATRFYGIRPLLTTAQLAEININNSLPTPSSDTALQDILEFKQKYGNKFRALRIAVDELYDEVLQSALPPRAESAAIIRLQNVVVDIRKCVNQTWLQRCISSSKFDFSLPASTVSAFGGYTIASAVGIPGVEAIGAAAGAALASIKFESKLGSVIKELGDKGENFAYLYHVETEFPVAECTTE